MPGFDASGHYDRWYRWVDDAANGIKITADRHDREDNEFSAALSLCILRDGRGQPTVSIPWNGQKITNLGNGIDAGDAVNRGQIDNWKDFKGLNITGADATGRITWTSSATGKVGNSYTVADCAFGVDGTTSFIWNDKPDFSGTDIMTLNANDVPTALTLKSILDSQGAGPSLNFTRSSATPAIGDHLGIINWTGKNSAAADKQYGYLDMYITDPVNNSEDANFYFVAQKAGTLTNVATIGGPATTFNADTFTVNGQIKTDHVVVSNGSALNNGFVAYGTSYGLAAGFWIASDNRMWFGAATAAGAPSGAHWLEMDATGGADFFLPLTTSSNFIATTGVYAKDTTFGLLPSGNYRYSVYNGTNYSFRHDVTTGDLVWIMNGSINHQLRKSDAALIHWGGQAYKPGGGSWADSSDERIKNITGPYETGLDQIVALNPVRFTFRGNDTNDLPAEMGAEPDATLTAPYPNSPHRQAAIDGTSYVGLIAQEVETVMPGMVSQVAGYIDGEAVTDLRTLDTTNLVFALINCIKTLAARVEALEGK